MMKVFLEKILNCMNEVRKDNKMDQDSNIYKKLLMEEQQQLPQISSKANNIPYQPVETEGECILLSVTPIYFSKPLYYLYAVFAILLLGIPAVFVYWYPRLKLYLYFEDSPFQTCTHFAIINYDKQITYAQKQFQETEQEEHSVSNQGYESERLQKIIRNKKKSVFFVNRYMKYRVKQNGGQKIVQADIFDYKNNLKKLASANWGIIQQKRRKSEGRREVNNFQEEEHQFPQKILKEQGVIKRRKRFGLGTMVIDRPSISVLFFRQIVQPLYFFILFSIILWMTQQYFLYCGAIFITSAVGIIINLYQTYQNNNKIHGMAYYEIDVNVLRNVLGKNTMVSISSKDVVPGDIVFLKQAIKIPFDGVIVQGSALINECALTGQSVPVVKKAEGMEDSYVAGKFNEKNCLVYEGTTIVQVDNKKKMSIFEEYRKQYGIPIYVIRTNFVTMKGQLIRIISFPIEKTSIFQKQSQKFLLILFTIACLSYAVLVVRLSGYVDASDIIAHFLDLITVTVPPGLPVSMTFGIVYALQKLKKKQIFCISPNKVIFGGLVDFICFDKTGTLTQDYMDFYALVPCVQSKFRQAIINFTANGEQGQINLQPTIEQIIKKNPYIKHSLTNMATNHTIVNIEATGQNVGDPMQIKLFQFGEFRFNDSLVQGQGQEQHGTQNSSHVLFAFDSLRGHNGVVVRRMDFDSELFRMSAIAKAHYPEGMFDWQGNRPKQYEIENQTYYVYTKGSPQAMYNIFSKHSLPHNYHDKIKEYASQGLRVLAIGHRQIDSKKQLHANRLEVQNQLQFDGFQVFENKLKPETRGALAELTEQAQIPCVMITGDNALTGCNISYKCKIADADKKMMIFDYKEEKGIVSEEFMFDKSCQKRKDMDRIENLEEQMGYQGMKKEENEITQKFMEKGKTGEQIQMKAMSYYPKKKDQEGNNHSSRGLVDSIKGIIEEINNGSTQLCLTGAAFDHLYSGNLQSIGQDLKTILQQTRVFARAKPNDKARIIMAYQKCLRKVVAMCGDGANDCGALKQADTGLSLSQTQASISSPFTSKITNISSMVQLIKQCRAGLVTNFSLFNIMALYSLIQYSTVVICQFYFSYPSTGQFTYWDIFGNFLFFMTVGYTGTAARLSAAKPSSSLFTLTNMSQVAIMYLIQLLGQLFMMYSLENIFEEQLDYDKYGGKDNNYQTYLEQGHSYSENTPQTNILFLFTNFLYIFSFIAFSFSKPWRKQFYTNVPFMIIFVLVVIYTILIVVVQKMRLQVFELSYMNNAGVNFFVLCMGLLFSLVIYFNQKCILEKLAVRIRHKYPQKSWI